MNAEDVERLTKRFEAEPALRGALHAMQELGKLSLTASKLLIDAVGPAEDIDAEESSSMTGVTFGIVFSLFHPEMAGRLAMEIVGKEYMTTGDPSSLGLASLLALKWPQLHPLEDILEDRWDHDHLAASRS